MQRYSYWVLCLQASSITMGLSSGEDIETPLQNESEEMNELDAINDLSEQAIKGEYLGAAIHGPRWILGLIDEAI